MSQRYFLQLSYKGTNYHGWQFQPNAVSVQEVIEMALSTILRVEISVVGAGRTDTGVHASYFMLHFDVENEIKNSTIFLHKMNSFLPRDIAVHQLWKVKNDAHARFNAISRTYQYFITTVKDPFSTETIYRCKPKPDIQKMNDAATILFDYEDFTSFSRLHTDVKTNNCKIYHATWTEVENRMVFTIKADRFLRNMVRAIVGTLLEIGKGKLSKEDFRNIIEQKNRQLAGASAPAHGLFLVDIEYPKEIFEI
jgi:tRNA pseudouridine38-40 synthase